jgi:hypothetical protein
MISPQDRGRARINFGKVLQGEKTGESEYEILKKDGTRFQGLIASVPIIRDHQPVGIRGWCSELRQTEEGLGSKKNTGCWWSFPMTVSPGRGDRHARQPKMAEISAMTNRRNSWPFGGRGITPGPEAGKSTGGGSGKDADPL